MFFSSWKVLDVFLLHTFLLLLLPLMDSAVESHGSLLRKYEGGRGPEGPWRVVDSEKQTTVVKLVASMFLPEGYPRSVSEDYLQYQIFDSLQAFCSSLCGQLSTQSVLQAIGVGNVAATPLAATLTWMSRDGVGMTGRILFAWGFARQLDSNPKGWRLVADIFNDLAMLLEITAGTHGWQNALLILCFTSFLRAIVGVAGGASRAALTQHQARRNNMADVAAKDGSQETAVNLLALIIGFFLIPWINMDPTTVWTVFLVATSCHILANYKAVTSVIMETLNNQRLRILVDHYLQTTHLLTPKEAAWHETLFDLGVAPRLGVSLGTLATSSSQWRGLCEEFKTEEFVLRTTSKGKIQVSLLEGAPTRAVIKACFLAHILLRLREGRKEQGPQKPKGKGQPVDRLWALSREDQAEGEPGRLDAKVYRVMRAESLFEDFERKALQAGWNLEHVYFIVDEWRVARKAE